MAFNFRKSLFGFNTNDVILYIKKSSETAKQKEEELTKQLTSANVLNQELSQTNNELNLKLAKFEEKCNEINLLCENISRIYLTTKASSQTVMEVTTQNCNIMQEQLDHNLNTLEEVQSALAKLKQQVNTTAGMYSKEVDSVNSCLETAKEVLISNKDEVKVAVDRFNEAIK